MTRQHFRSTIFLLAAACLQTIFAVGCIEAPEIYFSPHDNIKTVIVRYIKQEREAIKAALYLITDKEIALELSRAQDRGVRVELVVDRTSLDAQGGKVHFLHKRNVPIFIYDGGQESIMHDKFWVFSRNVRDKKIVITGSYNPTQKANTRNSENIVVLEGFDIFRRYEKEFERVKNKANRYRLIMAKEPEPRNWGHKTKPPTSRRHRHCGCPH